MEPSLRVVICLKGLELTLVACSRVSYLILKKACTCATSASMASTNALASDPISIYIKLTRLGAVPLNLIKVNSNAPVGVF